MKAINKILMYISGFLLVLFLLLIVEFGCIQNLFDNRVAIEDATVGADDWLIYVDDKPVERVKHGLIVTKVPFALVNPGNRKLTFCKSSDGKGELLVIETEVMKGKRYRVTTVNNKPVLEVLRKK